MDAMDIAPREVPSDELQAAIVLAQTGLMQACDAVSTGQEVRLVLAGLADTVGIFGKSIRRWEKATADIIAARNLSDNDRAALKEAMENGANKGMRAEARRMIRTIDSRLAVQIGIATGGAFVLGVVIVLLWLLWWSACFHLTDGGQVCGIRLRG